MLERADDSTDLDHEPDPSRSLNQTPLRVSERIVNPTPRKPEHGDFISLVTTISRAYQGGRYMDMQVLDEVEWQHFGAEGSGLQISEAKIALATASSLNFELVEVNSKILIRKVKTRSMNEKDVRTFNRELRILDHLHDSNNILKLHGIGWFIDKDPAQRVPVPAFVFEEAHYNLREMISRDTDIPIGTMLRVFEEMTTGLSALHDCGIVHGKLTVDNILLIRAEQHHRRDLQQTYTVKISNFAHALFDNGSSQCQESGTDIYQAPECGNYLDFIGLKLTDVYSLGVIFATVAFRGEEVADLDATKNTVNNGGEWTALLKKIFLPSRGNAEGLRVARDTVNMIRDLFLNTLQTVASNRNLDRLLQSFSNYFGFAEGSKKNTVVFQDDPPIEDVNISYSKFMKISSVLKDQMVEGLHKIVSLGSADPRYSQASFELGVFCISRYNSPTASRSEGLQYLWQAAEHGDLRARALYGRLQRAYACQAHPTYFQLRLKWLSSAASAGFRIALDELATIDPVSADTALKAYAADKMKKAFSGALPHIPHRLPDANQESYESSINFQIHCAAAIGSADVLRWLLNERPDLIDIRNALGDTPLVSACRFGHLETVLVLLKRSANASISNYSNENALHFLWRFESSKAQALFLPLLTAGADPEARANSNQDTEEWDLVPKSGAPIERMVCYNRLDLIRLFTTQRRAVTRRHQNQLYWLFLLAVRLQHSEIQKFLIDYATELRVSLKIHQQSSDKAKWMFRGKGRNYLDATVLGWVRQTCGGLDLPVDFWQSCYHGESWLDAMKATIDTCFEMGDNMHVDEGLLDDTIRLATSEWSHAAFEHLFRLKISATDGTHARLLSLEQIRWRLQESNTLDHTLEAPSAFEVGPMPINYVDQVFVGFSTLAQQALLQGDRTMFYILTHVYGANLQLPFESISSHGLVNCYSALAGTKHRDMWFAHELWQLNIPLSCPYEEFPKNYNAWTHPLKIALDHRNWTLSSWLIHKGANVFASAGHNRVVLAHSVLSGMSEIRHFLFPINNEERSIAWCIPAHMEVQGGYPVFLALFQALDSVIQSGKTFPQPMFTSIWFDLLNHYHDVENQPSLRKPSVLDMTMKVTQPYQPTSFDLLIVPSIRCHITVDASRKTNRRAAGRADRRAKTSVEINLVVDEVWSRRPQLIHKFLAAIMLGSPLDVLPIRQYFASGLWKYCYTPSIRWLIHDTNIDPIETLAWGSGITLAAAAIIYYIVNVRSFDNFVADGAVAVGLLFFGLFFGMAVWLALMAASILIEHVHVLTHGYVRLVFGPGVVPPEYFKWESDGSADWLERLLGISPGKKVQGNSTDENMIQLD